VTVTHFPGLVIAQDWVAKAGQANEGRHFALVLAPLLLDESLGPRPHAAVLSNRSH